MTELHRHVVHGSASVVLGELTSRAARGDGWDAGLAHSRGRLDKTIPAMSPNEDSGFLVSDGASFVWAGVADGHHGDYSSWHVVEALADRPDLLLADDDAVLAEMLSSNVALNEDRPPDQPDSRTTVVAVRLDLASSTLRWISAGDSTIGVRAPGAPFSRVNTHQHRFHGYWRESSATAATTWTVGSAPVVGGSLIVLTSDGFTDYLPAGRDESDVVQAAAAGDRSGETVATELVRAAFDGGAGDHVTTVAIRVA